MKALYRDLDLAGEFERYEAESYERLNALIDEIPESGSDDGLKREVFQSFLAKVYKRVSSGWARVHSRVQPPLLSWLSFPRCGTARQLC